MPNQLAQVIDYFLYLRGLDREEVRYTRYLRPAKELIELSGGVEEAKWNLEKMKEWADSKGLEWNIDTCVKRFLL